MDMKISPTKLEASSTTLDSNSHSHEIKILESLSDINGKVNTNNLAITAGSNLRVIAIRDSTYKDLKEFALTYESHPTFDTIFRKLFQAYKNKK